jgi:ATP-dependent DNA helicase RecG
MQELEALPARIAEKVADGLGLRRWIDLALHLPARYQDEATLSTVEDLVDNAKASLVGTLCGTEIQERPRRQLLARLDVDGGEITLRWLHFYPNQQARLADGLFVKVTGMTRKTRRGWEIIHPKMVFNPKPEELVGSLSSLQPLPPSPAQDASEAPIGSDARLTPVYPTVSGVKQADFPRWLKQAPAACFEELLPQNWCQQLPFPNWTTSLHVLHGQATPDTADALNERSHPAWQRIKFEELLAQQLALRQSRVQRETLQAPTMALSDGPHYRACEAALPFRLTAAQQRVVAELRQDMRHSTPMQRLLQGDVGSGKTIVAALACVHAADAQWQSAFMAPTEILAEQHLKKLGPLLDQAGLQCALLTGSTGKKERRQILERLLSGNIAVLIGTHALIEDAVQFRQLGLVVIDEQHRFGVAQRLALLRASGTGLTPHQLMMTATPIPRTLAQTYLSDLDVSTLDQKPPGRQPILTKLVSQKRREELYQSLRVELSAGKQVYWVCPLIEESETLELQAAEQTFAEISQAMPEQRIALVHGRLPSSEKADVMSRFARNEVQLLVSTTVIEVGVDVPNASVMVIEHAERFGLAQLHQLRGRVGRGELASICILLFGDPLSWTGKQRLIAMRDSQDGFWLAEKDLEIRGPGELLGKRQSGLPMLRYTDPLLEKDLVKLSRFYAGQVDMKRDEWAQRLTQRWFGRTEWWLS